MITTAVIEKRNELVHKQHIQKIYRPSSPFPITEQAKISIRRSWVRTTLNNEPVLSFMRQQKILQHFLYQHFKRHFMLAEV